MVREKNQNNSDFELLIAEISKRERIIIQQFEEAYIILGWEDGFRAGASEAFDKGYAQGVDEGFKDGYQEAKASSALYAEE